MHPFHVQVLQEIDARVRHALLMRQARFRAHKMLMDHPEVIPTEGVTAEAAADQLVEISN